MKMKPWDEGQRTQTEAQRGQRRTERQPSVNADRRRPYRNFYSNLKIMLHVKYPCFIDEKSGYQDWRGRERGTERQREGGRKGEQARDMSMP